MYTVQHEFDDEPTYVVNIDDDDDCVEISPKIPYQKRVELARMIRDFLNH
jgi:hypothetical protein